MLLEARAKINWYLSVTGVREDGYHLLDMLMQPISLCDVISLEPSDTLALFVTGNSAIPEDASNLAYRAATALRDATGCRLGAAIRVEKHIPVEAGLGGGSSDAAAVLRGLNMLWSLNLPDPQLEAIGLRLGADVPFCLRGGLCRVSGIGERIQRVSDGPIWPLVIIQPCAGLSTGKVFRAWRDEQDPHLSDCDALMRALAAGNLSAVPTTPGNALEPISRSVLPEIGTAIDALLKQGACCAQMSGSGSAVYGVFATVAEADRAAEKLRGRWSTVLRCATASQGVVCSAGQA